MLPTNTSATTRKTSTSLSTEKLQEVLPKFMAKVYENPVFQMADVDLKFSKPEARININRDKASIMGVSNATSLPT